MKQRIRNYFIVLLTIISLTVPLYSFGAFNDLPSYEEIDNYYDEVNRTKKHNEWVHEEAARLISGQETGIVIIGIGLVVVVCGLFCKKYSK